MAEQTFLTVDGSEMECLISVPAGGGPHPGLVLAPHLPADQGLKADAFSDGVADRYAEAGYVCAMPRVFHRQPLDRDRPDKLAAMNDDEVMRDLTAARELLEARDDVNADRIGVLGHCTGGRMTVLALTRDPRYKAGIDFWGGRVHLPWGDGLPRPWRGWGVFPRRWPGSSATRIKARRRSRWMSWRPRSRPGARATSSTAMTGPATHFRISPTRSGTTRTLRRMPGPRRSRFWTGT